MELVMTTKNMRKIVRIDEDKCNGCGVCVPACAEGALQIIDGKAKLINEIYCDGLGACLGKCPEGAITIEETVAGEFDEAATKRHLEKENPARYKVSSGCPSTLMAQFKGHETKKGSSIEATNKHSLLSHWPVQLTLVPPAAPFLQESDVVLVGDCVPFAYPRFHEGFLKDHSLLVACPKLDDFQAHLNKLTDIIKHSSIKSITVVRMEVPCCSGLVHMVNTALQLTGKDIPVKEVIVGIQGDLK
jgi:NAD-dependent dihydropyrimidine dehydrogenase PreA subunit